MTLNGYIQHTEPYYCTVIRYGYNGCARAAHALYDTSLIIINRGYVPTCYAIHARHLEEKSFKPNQTMVELHGAALWC